MIITKNTRSREKILKRVPAQYIIEFCKQKIKKLCPHHFLAEKQTARLAQRAFNPSATNMLC